MTLRVLVDATAIPADRGGVGRYVEELLAALDRLDLDVGVVAQERDAQTFAHRAPGVEVITVGRRLERRPVRLAWEQLVLPTLTRRWRADVLHSPHYTSPAMAGVPVAVTLHDATFFSHPEVHSRLKGAFFRAAVRRAAHRAAAVIVPSEATGREVRRFVGGSPARFHVAYHGVDAAAFHPVAAAERDRVRSTLGIGDSRYIAFLGTLEPRKNVPALVRGWADAMRARDDPPALVLAGGPGWDVAVDPALAAVPESLQARRVGYLPMDDLAGFLGGAEIVAYPSLGEGFGLPVLEAMACGAAVLTSRELSLPEVGGDAVAYTGTSSDEIAAGLSELLDAPARRAELGRAAAARAATFTWQESAEAHLRAYRAAAR